jgi:hypothetical protein
MPPRKAKKSRTPKAKPIRLTLSGAQRAALRPRKGRDIELRATVVGNKLVIHKGRKAGSRRRYKPTNSPFA